MLAPGQLDIRLIWQGSRGPYLPQRRDPLLPPRAHDAVNDLARPIDAGEWQTGVPGRGRRRHGPAAPGPLRHRSAPGTATPHGARGPRTRLGAHVFVVSALRLWELGVSRPIDA
jgi:hypothetical protein